MDNSTNTLKRKRDADNTQQDTKLQEYLAVMQHSSKTKTWANDEGLAESLNPVSASKRPLEEEQPNEEPSQSQRKKAKVDGVADASLPKTQAREKTPSTNGEQVVSHDSNGTRIAEQNRNEDAVEQDASAAPQNQTEPQSDADWLRSKTSRLLGLLDEDEQAEQDALKQRKTLEPVEEDDDSESGGVALDTPAAPVSSNAEKTKEEDDANINLIRNSGRLFVRNLPYDATEADLEPVFLPFGKIEEVSNDFFRTLRFSSLPPKSITA